MNVVFTEVQVYRKYLLDFSNLKRSIRFLYRLGRQLLFMAPKFAISAGIDADGQLLGEIEIEFDPSNPTAKEHTQHKLKLSG